MSIIRGWGKIGWLVIWVEDEDWVLEVGGGELRANGKICSTNFTCQEIKT